MDVPLSAGWLVATWDAPQGNGGITTQGRDLRELQDQLQDAIQCHFEPGEASQRLRLHFVSDPVLLQICPGWGLTLVATALALPRHVSRPEPVGRWYRSRAI